MIGDVVIDHAECHVCSAAEQVVADLLNTPVEKVHLGEAKSRVLEAEHLGVRSVPALVIDGQVFHINYGADLAILK
jgi:hypothetical protein